MAEKKKKINLAKKLGNFKKFKEAFSKNRKKSKLFVFTAFLVVFLFIIYLLRSVFLAAFINGRPITRLEVIRKLEQNQGKQTLDTLVTEKLILQEAGKSRVVIRDEQIQTEIEKIKTLVESQGTNLDQALALQGQTMENLKSNVRIQKIIEEILKEKLNVSDEEISNYFEGNKNLYGKDAKLEDFKEEIGDQLKQERLAAEFRKWIEDLKKKSKIIYFVHY
ncbi:MAG: PpiC-type peptidyl-prolyl cis-trans isomerase [Candidatus Woesebacteria bacterium GW2011_GWB1_38_5b]|uniref:peptidylprolyl isomerase n=2 Tax=Candidatus Woeseibacteriota TaxID=1752722 RepID=A0A0G0K5R7_9BACT|nr:MAG: PpiC-type peptidyl-prolyl cis-trans isomerase [Candidatus Woesebacteria bacterium GW2011_GWB1_38_5b]OGM19815.1 MAG: hypothetical protein A2686_04055 [Candidatus Woesebacteria bacterium RIFCSPHIGHO2_01_FULL_38_10]OGM59465.1 MAG: hypothetical protein A2892_02350 [Candidatus Woesebacteria bacterium RIFCSPLOWO2_01_FULL_39_10b]